MVQVGRPLEQSLALTPTWVMASVCVAISLAAERLLHRLGKAHLHMSPFIACDNQSDLGLINLGAPFFLLKFNGQEALFSALQRVKEALLAAEAATLNG
ncbi:hypothetical protein ABZP36_029701 [Zizania latifolia]